MNIVLWIGSNANQQALANKIEKQFPITGIIVEKRLSQKKITPSLFIDKLISKLFLPSIGNSWENLNNEYTKKYPNLPKTKTITVENINSDEAFDFTQSLQPDLIIVSGTRLIKDKMLSISPDIGILNLHTGLSPYIKGGPNCTNWCLATKQFHLIGNTIMWIDLGIDTGNLVSTEFTPLLGTENLIEIHFKVMEHAHDLYIRSIEHVQKSTNVNNIPQKTITKGVTYYTKQWSLKYKIKLIQNLSLFRKLSQSKEIKHLQKEIKTIEL